MNFLTAKSLSRRTILRGLGATVALPFLDAMVPALAQGQGNRSPIRMAFVYMPNGMEMRHWNPAHEGQLGDLPQTLQPLESVRRDILLLSNLTHAQGRAFLGEGGGDHGRCCPTYLTGVHPKKALTHIESAVSFDQIVAADKALRSRRGRFTGYWVSRICVRTRCHPPEPRSCTPSVTICMPAAMGPFRPTGISS